VQYGKLCVRRRLTVEQGLSNDVNDVAEVAGDRGGEHLRCNWILWEEQRVADGSGLSAE